jgi:hypothetical protein
MNGFLRLRSLLSALSVAGALLVCAVPSYAVPAMDVQMDVFLAQVKDLREELNLTPNQQTLWHQLEAKAHAIVGERRSRRDQMQASLKQGLNAPNAEIRDLDKKLEQEADISYQENKKLHELFLSMNDSLDDNQRRKILSFMLDQLERVPETGGDNKSCDQPKMRGTGRQRPNNPAGAQQ